MNDQTYKIVCFGDSTTAENSSSSKSEQQENYIQLKVYSTWLQEKLPSILNKNVLVINSGISGDTTTDAKKRFQTDVLDHNPAIVFIQFGANDQSIRHDLGKSTPSVSLEVFNDNLRYFITELKETNTKIILMTPGMMLWTDALTRSYFKHPYDIQDPLGLNANIKKYVQAICKLALMEGVALINIFNKQIVHSRDS